MILMISYIVILTDFHSQRGVIVEDRYDDPAPAPNPNTTATLRYHYRACGSPRDRQPLAEIPAVWFR